MTIQIFADCANVADISNLAGNPVVEGLTTNPSLLRKSGVTKYREFARYVLSKIGDKPVSFEVLADDLEGMITQATEISAWAQNVFVKIPVQTTKGESSSIAITVLSDSGVKVNVTAILTVEQMETAFRSLGDAPAIVSVFAGRIADTGRDPVALIKMGLIATKQWHRKNRRVLWASAREVYNVVQAEEAGCQVITLSPELIAKLAMFGKDLDELSLETVRQFARDAEGLSL